jgi:hypothetical protein
MLDHVERRRFLVEPARENPAPSPLRSSHEHFHERAGQLLLFPWRRGLAGAKLDDHVFPPRRLAGAEGDVLGDAVALVEDPEHRHALGHRRDPGLAAGRGRAVRGRSRLVLLLVGPTASGKAER